MTNLQNKTQTVSADLSTMPAIGAQYRYSDYTCVQVERSEDGKDVYLYYTFNNTHSFVVDFGLPLNIRKEDLNIAGNWTSASIAGAKYGTATTDADNGITYTPTQVLEGVETLRLTLTGDTGSTTHTIYIYPATTVYYEEGFMTLTGFTGGSKGTEKQATEAVGAQTRNVYGYDPAYVGTALDSQATSTTVGDTASFSFTGTGVDIYANCGTNTGTVLITVKKGNDVVKMLTVDTHMQEGTTSVTGSNKQSVAAKNVPIASIDGLPYDSYSVTIKHVASKLGANKPVYLDGFRVHGTLGPKQVVYAQNGENAPNIVELRDLVLKVQLQADASSSDLALYREQLAKLTDDSQIYKAAVISTDISGVAQDGADKDDTDSVKDLVDNGPKNEVYLAHGETLMFTIDQAAQVGVKCLNGGSGTIESTGSTDEPTEVTAQTDMFYAVEAGTVTITNSGSGTLAVTELKFTSNT